MSVKDYTLNRDEILRSKARDLGMIVVKPETDEIFLDIDSPDRDLATLKQNLAILNENGLSFRVKKVTISKSGEGLHVVIGDGPVLDDWQRVALQAVLGSDLKREALALVHVFQGEKNASVFFEEPALPPLPTGNELVF